jgi:hypothetical protein
MKEIRNVASVPLDLAESTMGFVVAGGNFNDTIRQRCKQNSSVELVEG